MKHACLSETWLDWRGRPFGSVLALCVLGIVLAVPAAVGWWYQQFAVLLQDGAFKAQPQLTVFLAVNAPRQVTEALEARLKALPEVRHTRLLAREETLARLKQTRNLAEALAALPGNPFPDAIVVTPADESPAAIEALAATVRDWREAAHVLVDADWAQRLAALARLARDGALLAVVLMACCALGAFWLALGNVRGAAGQPACVRMTGGALLGLGGSLLAVGIVAAGTLWLRPSLLHVSALYDLDFMLALPSAGASALFVGALVILGALLGLLRR